jgi:hypothetical protein
MTESINDEIQTELTITDLRNIALIIETCTSKGFFQAGDLVTVGDLYNKIIVCLKNIDQNQ